MTFTRLATFAGFAGCACMAGIALPSNLRAQVATGQRPTELGIDAAVVRETSDFVKSTTFQLPVSRFRVGFFLSDVISLEPSIALGFGSTTVESPGSGEENTSSGTSYELDVGLLYHFRTDRTHAQPYLRPFVGVRGFSSDSDNDNGEFDASGTQAQFGAALGFKVPAGNRLGTRVEVGYRYRSESEPEFRSTNSIFLALGLSFFTR